MEREKNLPVAKVYPTAGKFSGCRKLYLAAEKMNFVTAKLCMAKGKYFWLQESKSGSRKCISDLIQSIYGYSKLYLTAGKYILLKKV